MGVLIGITADDMFYYLEIARNIGEGNGPTFDGSTPTNGWHPLWMGLLVLLQTMVGDAAALVHVALSVLVLAHLATGVALWRVAGEVGGSIAGLAAMACWIFLPAAGQITLSGVEAPLATAALAWCLVLQTDGKTEKGAFRLGLCMGLACLARTDSALICMVIFCAVYLPFLREQSFVKSAWKLPARCVGGGAILLLPWLFWNLMAFGRISQDSARALYFKTHTPGSGSGLWDRWMAWMDALGKMVGLSGGLLFGGLLVALAISVWAIRRRHRAALVLFCAVMGVLSVAAVYTSYLWFRQDWYLLSSLMLLSLIVGLAIGLLFERLEPRMERIPQLGRQGLVLLLIAGVSLPESARLTRLGAWPYPWQRMYLEIAEELDERLPEGSRVGAFNAGIYGYFTELDVVNLDGVVNGDVLEAMEDQALLAYVHRAGITHIVDHYQAYVTFGSNYAEPEFLQSALIQGPNYPNTSSGGDIYLNTVKPQILRP